MISRATVEEHERATLPGVALLESGLDRGLKLLRRSGSAFVLLVLFGRTRIGRSLERADHRARQRERRPASADLLSCACVNMPLTVGPTKRAGHARQTAR